MEEMSLMGHSRLGMVCYAAKAEVNSQLDDHA